MLEASLHGDNTFVTLTYSELFLPRIAGTNLNTLIPKDLQLFLKRFRKAMEPSAIRFFGCGEYGDQSERAHYHLAMFNVPACRYGSSRYKPPYNRKNCCDICDRVRDAWGMGRVDLDELNQTTAAYIAGYVVKKMTGETDPRLNGRHKEFSRQSNRPGIGADFMWEAASTMMKFSLDDLSKTEGDVPVTLRHGSKEMPLGRYLRRKLRKYLGRDEKTPDHVLQKLAEEMQPLREAQFATKKKTSLQETVLKHFEGERLNFNSRQRIRKQRKTKQ